MFACVEKVKIQTVPAADRVLPVAFFGTTNATEVMDFDDMTRVEQVAAYLRLKRELGYDIEEDEFLFVKFECPRKCGDGPDDYGWSEANGWHELWWDRGHYSEEHLLVKHRKLVDGDDEERLEQKGCYGTMSWHETSPRHRRYLNEAIEHCIDAV